MRTQLANSDEVCSRERVVANRISIRSAVRRYARSRPIPDARRLHQTATKRSLEATYRTHQAVSGDFSTDPGTVCSATRTVDNHAIVHQSVDRGLVKRTALAADAGSPGVVREVLEPTPADAGLYFAYFFSNAWKRGSWRIGSHAGSNHSITGE